MGPKVACKVPGILFIVLDVILLDVLLVRRNKSFPLEAEKVVMGSYHPKI